MPLRTLILNILTFGYYALKKTYEDKIHQAKVVTREAEDFHEKLKKEPPRMVAVELLKTDNLEFQRRVYELSQDKILRCLLYHVQQDIFEMMNNSTDAKAVEIMGMSKGIKYLLKAIEANNVEYVENSKPKANGDAVYV